MWKKISSLINSGKKLKISPEKLFSLAIANSFQGSIVAHSAESTEMIYFNLPEISSDSAIEALAFSISSALFSLSDATGQGKYVAQRYEFLHTFISGYPDALIASKLVPHKAKVLAVRKEVNSLPPNIIASVQKCIDKQRVPVSELISNSMKGVYFLLLTGFATLSEPTESEQKRINSGIQTGETASHAKTAEEKLQEYHQHIKKTSTPEQQI
jgi:hypothetical protein